MEKNVPIITHSDGTKMPGFGLGTYTSQGGDCEIAVKAAIDAGYRHIDTAHFYLNEAEVGKAIKDKIDEGVIKREDIYLVTKLWCHFHEPERVEHACRMSLQRFGLEYVDLYLMHWPYAYPYRGDEAFLPTDDKGNVELSDTDYIDTWKAMEKLVDLGLTKSIGVSNFNSQQLKRLLDAARIKPIHNQIECHPALKQTNLTKFCKEHNIVVTAYCPLGRPEIHKKLPHFLFDGTLQKIGDKYKKTAAQVVLRYLLEIGVVPIPKSISKNHLAKNIDIFDFKLSDEDHKIISKYNTGERVVPMDHAIASKFYPFNFEE